MLKVRNLYCGYDGKDVIKDFNIDITRGQNVSIVGPNGCGKSTLLKAMVSLIDYKGNIFLDGKEVKSIKRKELAKKVAIMSQSSQIYFPYTVYDTVALGRYAHIDGVFARLSKRDEEIILNCLSNVGILDLKDKLINELSGGQLQRVYLARVFAQEPDIILLDEPTNHLDLKCQIEILEHINKWTKENQKTVIGVLHDLNLVQMFSDDVIMLSEGNIVSKGKTKDVLSEDKLEEVYGLNIKKFMINALEKWR
ncbi:MAG: ABC transporter ATP-binding protein [Clostridium sp.]|uniref:ABC transporter ATP-binding protein n=1 Tax=Clostridium TaxID=1485 RepID=UPI00232E0ABB|nr:MULTISPECIES: ABC transporter ATP-binding protein [Clostridium]MDB2118848.1 ABC transporter ATP-binding protein [Clostridium paraputrificum]MDU2755171.1 ABC transporter ATP-binding protein [Clostridium sp.]MDU2900169.1 ABC transporter ATP-binding protein [Clostridium sp.]MDU4425988.1 ABC transporter ATP-binding protein [Clostridium sp.]MDU7460369.1 ABC transporter ATP-binding protein [Clostridium sp.]